MHGQAEKVFRLPVFNWGEGMPELNPVTEDQLQFNDAPRLIWIKVRDALGLLWERNPKLHAMDQMAESIGQHGFQELPKYDSQIGIKAGNGRVETLGWMENQKAPLPRGLAMDKSGAWVMPLLVGVDAPSHALAEAYAVDSNNLTMSGGDFNVFDMARMWDEDTYKAILQDLARESTLPVSVSGDDLDVLLAPLTDPTKEWQGMPEFNQENKNAFRTLLVHFEDVEAVTQFANLLQQTITPDTKFLWYPKQERPDLKNLVYKDES